MAVSLFLLVRYLFEVRLTVLYPQDLIVLSAESKDIAYFQPVAGSTLCAESYSPPRSVIKRANDMMDGDAECNSIIASFSCRSNAVSWNDLLCRPHCGECM